MAAELKRRTFLRHAGPWRALRRGAGFAATATTLLLLSACTGGTTAGSTSFPGAATPTGSWPYPNGDLANTRDATSSVISSKNVSALREAWSLKLTGTPATGVKDTGAFAAAPVVAGGVVYIQDLDCNVYAVSLATGKLKWEYQVGIPEKSGPGPNGVAVSDGKVYGDTPDEVFALSASTGKVDWTNSGVLGSGEGSFEIQPAVADGRVYLASAYGSGRGGGVLLALSASSGHVLWKFETVTSGTALGVSSLGLGSGGAWETPLVGTDGSVTFGVGNPYQSIGSAVSHPSRQLYTDSLVNLDAVTGKLRWYYQAVPNDFKDHDIQASPVETTVDGLQAIIGSGKLGFVIATNAATGTVLWKTPVGAHNGTDDDSLHALSHRFTPKYPYTYEPGALGGVLSNIAVADGSVYVATLDLPFTLPKSTGVNGTPSSGAKAGGEVEALSLATGNVQWDTRVSSLPLGATTVSGDLVFTTLYSGELLALDRTTGAVIYRHELPASTNAPIAVFGNTVLIPAGAPKTTSGAQGAAQLIAYTVRSSVR
ncbi:PQQ-dependent methanol/ethanol family dehydrogenase [Humibacter ginsengiterrae]